MSTPHTLNSLHDLSRSVAIVLEGRRRSLRIMLSRHDWSSVLVEFTTVYILSNIFGAKRYGAKNIARIYPESFKKCYQNS